MKQVPDHANKAQETSMEIAKSPGKRRQHPPCGLKAASQELTRHPPRAPTNAKHEEAKLSRTSATNAIIS
jgi:hypothetical protein